MANPVVFVGEVIIFTESRPTITAWAEQSSEMVMRPWMTATCCTRAVRAHPAKAVVKPRNRRFYKTKLFKISPEK